MLFSYRIKILVPCSENIVPVTIICNTDLEKMFPGIPSIKERKIDLEDFCHNIKVMFFYMKHLYIILTVTKCYGDVATTLLQCGDSMVPS